MSEPPAKVICRRSDRGTTRSGFSSVEVSEDVMMEYLVRVCFDVFVEVLRYGTRKKMTKLERIGRRVHQIIANFYEKAPFHRLNLKMKAGDDSVQIGSHTLPDIDMWMWPDRMMKRVKSASLHRSTRPPFLRFDHVELDYCNSIRRRVPETCALLKEFLHPLKEHLDGAWLKFFGRITQHQMDNDDTFLNRVNDELIPVYNMCRGYELQVQLYPPAFGAAPVKHDLISSILQLSSIAKCSVIKLGFELNLFDAYYHYYDFPPQLLTPLPVEVITDWLVTTPEGIEANRQKTNAKFLYIKADNIQNGKEMCEHLEEVFRKAKNATAPFTLTIGNWREPFEEKTILNKMTGEEMRIFKQEKCGQEVTIKKMLKKYSKIDK